MDLVNQELEVFDQISNRLSTIGTPLSSITYHPPNSSFWLLEHGLSGARKKAHIATFITHEKSNMKQRGRSMAMASDPNGLQDIFLVVTFEVAQFYPGEQFMHDNRIS